MSQLPEKLDSWPAAFDAQARKINQIIDALRPLANIEGRNGIKVTVSDMNIVVEIPSPDENDGGGGSGSGTTLPTGAAGDMLYHDGADWVLITAPTVSVADPVLRHNGTTPYWEEPESC